MTLCEYVRKLTPKRRRRIHFSKEYMYVMCIPVWDIVNDIQVEK